MSKKKAAWEAMGFIERANQSAKDRELTMSGKRKKPATKKSSLKKATMAAGGQAGRVSTITSGSVSWSGSGIWETLGPRELNLPTREQVDPIRVFKFARLVWNGDHVSLQGVAMSIVYEIDATAKCGICEGSQSGKIWFLGANPYGFDPKKPHDVPDAKCSCGFHGVEEKHAPQLHSDYGAARYVRVEAELFGRVVRHQLGYRAERQRVLSVAIPRQCRTFGTVANSYTGGWVETECSNVPSGLRIDAGEIIPSCVDHAPFGALVPPTDIAKMLGAQVRWYDAERPEPPAALEWSDVTDSQ